MYIHVHVTFGQLLGDRYADFEALNNVEKTSYVLGSELWEQNFKSLLSLVIVNVWEVRKQKLYGDAKCPNQLQSQSSPGGLGGATGVEGQRDGKFRESKFCCVCYACRVSVAACNVCVLMHVHVLVGVSVSVIMCILAWIRVHVCVALPIVVGAWPMAGTLWRLFEYCYYLIVYVCVHSHAFPTH